MKKYEAMFLFDAGAVGDYEKAKAEVDRLMERAGARVLVCGKWDERRLAYEIRGCKRGLYLLVYFEAETSAIPGIERDAQISDLLVRSLVLRADHVSEEQMQQALTSTGAAAPVDAAGPVERRPDREGPPELSEERGVVAATEVDAVDGAS